MVAHLKNPALTRVQRDFMASMFISFCSVFHKFMATILPMKAKVAIWTISRLHELDLLLILENKSVMAGKKFDLKLHLPSSSSGTGFPGTSSRIILVLESSFPSQQRHGNSTVSPSLLVTVTSSTNIVLPRPYPSSPMRSFVICN